MNYRVRSKANGLYFRPRRPVFLGTSNSMIHNRVVGYAVAR